MIRKDYEHGGFPINKRNPVLCFFPGDASHSPAVFIAYDRSTLKAILTSKTIVKCLGIWPGKMNTDCFPLNVEDYKDIPTPPSLNRDIDNATSIVLTYSKKQKLSEVRYSIPKEEGDGFVEIVSKDPDLEEYVTKAGLKHNSIIEE